MTASMIFTLLVCIVLFVLYHILKAAFKHYMLIVAALLVWLLLIALLAKSSFLMNFDSWPPRMSLVLVPSLSFVLFAAYSKKMKPIIDHTSQSLLIYTQSVRLAVEGVLFLLVSQGSIPTIMSWEGRNMDIIIGLSAPMMGLLYAKKKNKIDSLLKIWNCLGILLLLNVLFHGLFSAPTAFQLFMVEPENIFVASWPYVWLPGFIVPAALFLHVISLRKLSK